MEIGSVSELLRSIREVRRGKVGFWLASDMTVRTRRETTNRATGWLGSVGKGDSFPIPSQSCCSTAHAPVEVEMWMHRFGRLAERRRSKKTGEHTLDQQGLPRGFYYVKDPKNTLAHFPKRHLGLTCVQSMRVLPRLAHHPQLAPSFKIPTPCSRTPVQRSAAYVSPTSSPSPPKTN